jgi:synaptic vesicle membrane protein VAT-1
VNYADICARWGVYESALRFVGWPITPGFEYSGYVEEVGREVKHLKSGDAVFGVTFTFTANQRSSISRKSGS